MKKVYIYNKYNRFWHWTQAALILFLAVTGFEIHGSFELFGYDKATYFHDNAAWALIILIVFTVFWDFTMGEWKQYVPSLKMMKEQINYYIFGIFKNAPHPVHKTKYTKFNPLQRMTYLGLKMFIIPTMIISGLLYFFFFSSLNTTNELNLEWIAYVHTFGAFILLGFVFIHVYLTSTGETITSSVEAMITGWECMSDEDAKYAFEEGLNVKLSEMKSELGSSSLDTNRLLSDAFDHIDSKFGINTDQAMRNAINKSGVGYFKIGRDGIYQEVNEGWLNLYKCRTREMVIGQQYGLNRTPEDRAIVDDIFNRVMKGESVHDGHVKRVCKDGFVGYHILAGSPVFNNDGEVIAMEGFIIDTTDKQ